MPINPTPQRLDQTVRVLQIIVGALMAGVVTFAAVVIIARIGKPAGGNSFLSMVAVVFAISVMVLRLVVGIAMVAANRYRIAKGTWPSPASQKEDSTLSATETDADRLLAAFQQVTIVQCALPEGAAFFNLIAYVSEGYVWSLAIVAVLMLWMSSSFPTRDSVANWIGRQLELIELERGQPS